MMELTRIYLLFAAFSVIYGDGCSDSDLEGSETIEMCGGESVTAVSVFVEFPDDHILPCTCNITTESIEQSTVSFIFVSSPLEDTCNSEVVIDNPLNTFDCGVSSGTNIHIGNVSYVTRTTLVLTQVLADASYSPDYCVKIKSSQDKPLTVNCLETRHKPEISNPSPEHTTVVSMIPESQSAGANSQSYTVATFAVVGVVLIAMVIIAIYILQKRLSRKASGQKSGYMNPEEDGNLYFIISKNGNKTERKNSGVYSQIDDNETPIDRYPPYVTIVG